jgi:hypothetical protein
VSSQFSTLRIFYLISISLNHRAFFLVFFFLAGLLITSTISFRGHLCLIGILATIRLAFTVIAYFRQLGLELTGLTYDDGCVVRKAVNSKRSFFALKAMLADIPDIPRINPIRICKYYDNK